MHSVTPAAASTIEYIHNGHDSRNTSNEQWKSVQSVVFLINVAKIYTLRQLR